MKRITFIILTMLILCSSISAQNNFAPVGAVWNYEGYEYYCEGNHIQYRVENETVIDGKNCSIISSYQSNDIDTMFQKTNDSLIVWENAGQVYFMEEDSFYLLYDFDVQIGDTIVSYDPINKNHFSSTINLDPSNGPLEIRRVVIDIEPKTISNQELKFYTINYITDINSECFGDDVIIEKIGSTSQKINGDCSLFVAAGCFGGFQCYNDNVLEYNNENQFFSNNPGCDFLENNIDLANKLDVAIFPNPFENEINIEFINVSSKSLRFEIVNMNGICVYKTEIESSKQIELNDIDQGFYLYYFKNGNGIVRSGKIVKI